MKLFGYKKTRGGKILRTFALIIVVIFALGAGVLAAFNIFITPPEISDPDSIASEREFIEPSPSDEITEETDEQAVDEHGRLEGMYTFLIAGEDNEYGGTDVIMIGRLDTYNHELNLMSIPRDTLVDVPWETRKINSYKNMYQYLDEDYDEYIDAMIDGIKELIGFEVDSYITVDLKGFVALVDAVGGVEFDVPQNMKYSDPAQKLYIDLVAGEQTLDGDQAMQLVRYRRYTDGDLERINVQHDFMTTLANQLISTNPLAIIEELVTIFNENVDTDMNYSNLLWYAKEFLSLDTEDIHFYTADTSEYVNGGSYRTFNADMWLDQINEYINPYFKDITIGQLNILTQDRNGKIVQALSDLNTPRVSSDE